MPEQYNGCRRPLRLYRFAERKGDCYSGLCPYAGRPHQCAGNYQKIKAGYRAGDNRSWLGGDRDRTKRAVMGEVACEHSDKVIFTSDNPRSEDPLQILADMEERLPVSARRKFI